MVADRRDFPWDPPRQRPNVAEDDIKPEKIIHPHRVDPFHPRGGSNHCPFASVRKCRICGV